MLPGRPVREDYVLVVSASCRRLDGARFSTESAFAEHVRMLRKKLTSSFRELFVAAPSASEEAWLQNRHHWAVIDERIGLRSKTADDVLGSSGGPASRLPDLVRR